MKKTGILLGMLLSCGVAVGQPTEKEKKSESVEIVIDGNKVTIEAENMDDLSEVDLNNIIREVSTRSAKIMQQQSELLAQVEKQLANGEITEEEAEDMRELIHERTEESMEVIGELMEAWGESYEARMEVWEQEYEAKMEAWEAEMESNAENGNFKMPPLPPLPPVPGVTPPHAPHAENDRRIIINEDGITIRRGADGEEPFALRFENEKEMEHDEEDDDDIDNIDRTETYFDIHLGFNQPLLNGQDFITEGNDELRFWKSTAFELGLGGKTRIGSPYSKLYFKWGGEFSWHNFRLMGSNLLQKYSDSVSIINDSTRSISKSKYHIAYFNVPLMLQLDFSEAGEMDESFTLGVGGYAGVRINAKTELEYSSDLFEDAEEKIKSSFFTNQFRYGVMAQLGWESFKITAKYDLNPLFQEGKGPDYQVASLNFGFTF